MFKVLYDFKAKLTDFQVFQLPNLRIYDYLLWDAL